MAFGSRLVKFGSLRKNKSVFGLEHPLTVGVGSRCLQGCDQPVVVGPINKVIMFGRHHQDLTGDVSHTSMG